MNFRKLTAALATACVAGVAFAAINGGVTTSGINQSQDYFANFKYTGLGNFTGRKVDASLTGTVSAEFACFNRGNNIPQGTPFKVPATNSVGTSSVTVGRNGAVKGSVILGGAEASSSFSCKGTMQLCQTSASFTNMNFSASIDGSPLPGGTMLPDQITTGKFNCQASSN